MVGLTTKARFPPRYGLRGPLFIAIAAVAVIAIALCLDSAAIVAVQQIPSGVKAVFAWLSYLSEPLLVLSAIACGLTVTGLLPSNIGQPALTVVFRFFGLCLVSSLLSLFVVFVGKALIGRAALWRRQILIPCCSSLWPASRRSNPFRPPRLP